MRSDVVRTGVERAAHRALIKAMGYTDEELYRPLIGVANTWNEVVPGHIHLDKITQAAKAGVRMAGGTPMEFGVIGMCDGIAMGHEGMRYSLVTREIIADSVECMAKAYQFDGLVLVPNCDKIVPAMLMAAARVDIPTIIISGGPMMAGRYMGGNISVTQMFEGMGSVMSGTISECELSEMEDSACPGCGSCAGMFTANSMNCLTEALGMALPGNGSIPAVYAERIRLAKKSGMKIMELVEKDIRPSAIMTKQAFENALAVDMALGCSTNTALHVPAIAHEAGADFDLFMLNEVSQKTPHLATLSPAIVHPSNDPKEQIIHHMQDFHEAGGVSAVLNELGKNGLVDLSVKTVSGTTMGEAIANAPIKDPSVIRTVDNPYHKEGGLAVLSGNLCPDGAVVKQSAVDPEALYFEGTAKVFECEDDAVAALLAGKIGKGNIIVVRNEGPKGGPGMREMLTATATVSGMGMSKDIALITDGRFSGATRGAAIGHISPEAASGGTIGLLKDGDKIVINIPEKKLDVLLSDEELAQRRKEWVQPEPRVQKGYLARYAKMVSSAAKGAIID